MKKKISYAILICGAVIVALIGRLSLQYANEVEEQKIEELKVVYEEYFNVFVNRANYLSQIREMDEQFNQRIADLKQQYPDIDIEIESAN